MTVNGTCCYDAYPSILGHDATPDVRGVAILQTCELTWTRPTEQALEVVMRERSTMRLKTHAESSECKAGMLLLGQIRHACIL